MKSQIALLMFIVSLKCHAEPQRVVTIITGNTPGWADSNDSGFAVELIRDFAIQSKSKVRLDVFPLKRAVARFIYGEEDCFIGGDSSSARNYFPTSMMESKPIRSAGIVIYSSRTRPLINNVEEAARLRLGVERGFDFRVVVQKLPAISKEPASARLQLKKMAIGRIDGYVGLFPPSKDNAALVHFNPDVFLFSYTDTLQCREGMENSKTVSEFNKFLENYRRSGQLMVTFNRYFPAPTTGKLKE